MSGGATNERYVLGVDYDVTGLREFLQQLQIIPAALRELNGAINAQPLGSASAFREKGRDLGVAFYRGLAAQAAGFKIDLGQFVVGQLGGAQTKAQMRELEQDATRLAARLQQLGIGSALGRTDVGAEVNAMRSLQTAATQTSTSVTRLNAQVAFLLGQLREVSGVSIPRQLLDAQGNVRRGGPAIAAAGIRPEDVPVNRTARGAIDQGAARSFVQGQLDARRATLQQELAAVEASRAQSLAQRAVAPFRPTPPPPIATAAATPPPRPFVVDQGGAVLGRVGDAVLREVQATQAQTSATQANTRAQERVAAVLTNLQTARGAGLLPGTDSRPFTLNERGERVPVLPARPAAGGAGSGVPPLPPVPSPADDDDDDPLRRRYRNLRSLGEFDGTFADFKRTQGTTIPTAADVRAQARSDATGVPNYGQQLEQEQINALRREASESARRQQEAGRRDAFSGVGPEEEQNLIRATAALAAARQREAARLAAGLSVADRDRIAAAQARNQERRQRVITAVDAQLASQGVTPDVAAGQAAQRARLAAIRDAATAAQTASLSDAQLRAQADAKIAAAAQSAAKAQGTQDGRTQAGVTPETLRFEAAQAARARSADEAARAEARAARSQEDLTRRAESRQSRLDFNADRAGRAERLRAFQADSGVPLGTRLRASINNAAPGDTRQPFGEQFREGFLGTGESSPVFQFGQAAKFSVFYGAAYAALFQLSQGFGIAARGAIEFEDALADLSVVTQRGRAENERFADTLGELGTDVGFTAGQGVQAGARALGLFGATDADQQAQNAVADASVSVAGRIAFLGNQKDLDATQLQLAGLVRAFDLSPFQQSQIEDTLAVLSRETGRPATEFLDAAAQIGTQARAAGFDLPETGAQIATIATTTGDTPTAVAGYLAQIFAKADDPAVEQRLASVGVNVNGTSLAEQLQQLGGLDLSPEARNQINSSFGRGGRVAGALGVLQNEQTQINRLTESARNAEEGLGEEQFQKNIAAIGQQIRLTGAAFQELAKDLALTGAFDFFYALVFGTREFLEAADELVDLFNALPRPIRTAGFAILEIVAVMAILRRQSLATAAVGLGTGALNAGSRAVGAIAGGALAPAALAGAARGAAGRARDSFRGEEGASNRRAAAGGIVGTVAGALLSVNEQQDLTRQIVSQFEDAQTAGGAAGTDVQGLRDAAAQFAQASRDARESQEVGADDFTTLFLAPLLRRLPGGETERVADEGERRSDVFTALAERTQAAQDRAAAQNPLTEVSSFTSAEALNTQLGSLEARGFTAAQRLAMLNESFGAFIDFTSRAAQGASTLPEAFTRGVTPNQGALILPGREEELAIGVGTSGLTGVQKVIDNLRAEAESAREDSLAELPGFGVRQTARLFAPRSGFTDESRRAFTRGTEVADSLAGIDPAEIQGRLEAVAARELDNLGTTTSSGIRILSPADVNKLEEVATAELRDLMGPAFDELPSDIQRALTRSVSGALRQGIGAFSPANATAENVGAFATSAAELVEPTAARAELYNGPVAGAQARTRALRGIIDQAEAGIAQIEDPAERIEAQRRIVFLRDLVFQAQKQEVEASAQVAASLLSLRISQLPTEDVIGRLDLQIAAANQRVIEDPSNENVAARNNLQEQRRAADRQRSASAATSGINPANQRALLGAQIATAEAEVDRLRTSVPDSQAFFDAERNLAALYNQRGAYALQLAQLVATNAVPLDDDLGQANVAIANAERQIAAARANGDELGVQQGIAARNQGVQQRNQVLEQDESDALAVYRARQLSQVTPGDSIQAAAVQIRIAETEMRNADRDSADYYNALAALNQAQQAYSDALVGFSDRTRRLGIDLTDPVQVAAADLAAARDRLRAADTPDERQQGQLDVRGAQASEEAARFQQRIGDLQVAEDLGRISNAQYLSYLDAERDRLQAVTNRTRQQQDQLNEVEQLLKSASEQIDSQFNLGDIKLPTVYEVRRAIGQGGTGNLVASNTTNNQVTINGADLAAIIGYLQEIGVSAQGIRTTSPRRA